MGWLGNYINKISSIVAGSPPKDWTFVPSIPSSDIQGINEPIQSEMCYIELYLESLRLEQAREFTTNFHGVVYSFITIIREGEEKAHLTAISKPEQLAKLDKNSFDHTILISKQMMGATAFRGNPVSIELGLFSVKSGNLLTPILDYITRVSSIAGISFVGAIKPFVPLIVEGMDLIAGQHGDTVLEVGIDTDLTLTKGCVAAIIACPKGTVDTTKLTLDKDHKLLINGVPLEYGYAVFSMRCTSKKSDYGEIPELKELWKTFSNAIKAGKRMDARSALDSFRLATIASPDLIEADRNGLIQLATQKFNAAFPPEGKAIYSADVGEVDVGELSDIGLYEKDLS